MKNTQKILSVIAALTLAVSLPAEIMTTSTAAAVSQKSGDREQLTITDEAGLIKFAKACSIDSYSKNLYVTLGSDIELSGEFTPIPVFGGVFDGAGHTISGLNITSSGSYSGLFRYVQRGALVKDLTVKGPYPPRAALNTSAASRKQLRQYHRVHPSPERSRAPTTWVVSRA